MNHSPLPWRAVRDTFGVLRIWMDEDGAEQDIAAVQSDGGTTREEDEANATYIVRAANNFEALLEACKGQVLANGHTLQCICSQGKDRDMGRKPQCYCEALRSTITKAEPETKT